MLLIFEGKVICFVEKDVCVMGRIVCGVWGVNLLEGGSLIFFIIFEVGY